ncbi:hypothetical protein HY570_04200 [Candidatus Micrarchaeota archaeon]|nr:hypothetical protein [Candidatus Micrarchaeota archaeon]
MIKMETVNLNIIYNKLKKIEEKMATKEELDSLAETLEIVANPKTMKQILAGKSDIRSGKTKIVKSTRDLF